MDKHTLSGLLCEHYGEEGHLTLYLSSVKEPLAKAIGSLTYNKFVTIRYWVTDKECTKDEASEDFLKKLYGKTDSRFGSCYSDLTGYLWTDEYCRVGGHDIIKELRSHVGKWLIMEIEIGKKDA